ncbi:hypothetical protein PMAYCL1PPCAC_04445, partial [Pristionchus mayeri]
FILFQILRKVSELDRKLSVIFCWAERMFSTIAFYPSLQYNLIRNFIQPTKWQWYNRIDNSLILGAMPFQSMADELILALLRNAHWRTCNEYKRFIDSSNLPPNRYFADIVCL